jgi:hypothetical protein
MNAALLEAQTSLLVAESDDASVVGYARGVVRDAADLPQARPRSFGVVTMSWWTSPIAA